MVSKRLLRSQENPRAGRIGAFARQASLLVVLLALSSGCMIGPDYKRPTVETPSNFKWGESPASEKVATGRNGQTANGTSRPSPEGMAQNIRWRKALPQDVIAKGDWWKLFDDPVLDQLESQLSIGNQQIKVAFAQATASRAQVGQSLANFFPNVGVAPFYSNISFSQNQPFFLQQHQIQAPVIGSNGQQIGTAQFPVGLTQSWQEYAIPGYAVYEADIWGQLRRGLESAKANAQATQAAYETVILSLHAELAIQYFFLRYIDAQLAVYKYMVDVFRDNLYLVQSRYDGGVANELDLARAKTDLATAQSQYIGLQNTRAQAENAIATLLGKPASTVRVASNALRDAPPVLPAYLPSDLLQRRPDVAQAERQMARANATIGMALGAFFPSVNLFAVGGLISDAASLLFQGGSRFWSIGPFINIPLFEGGRLVAGVEFARASYQAAVANYRQQVLSAFQETENALAAIKILLDQQEAQNRTVAFAKQQYDVSLVRFKEGMVNYIEVDTTMRVWLTAQLVDVQILGQRYIALVSLIRALGGGWKDYSMRPLAAKPEGSALPSEQHSAARKSG
ncbi:efflux transporter outer membrane subunit [Methylacidimicrobium sp. B4]|uniref:efflux transporter outer membrane subunit n=1 Tax=Methylacidimicrobium sp. B4 TaxID=2796139 RepID=UPI001A8BFD59|nr:efflux transporter outer membrane subunit [Methylacidimicrobium sp. B4]QSR83927.1 efflux transporter outer membrane subunit [Methylacidimicrobium sp. B4]